MEERATNSERRRAPREKMLGTGLMSWSSGNRSMQCVVLDWTDSGARIKPSDMLGCPDQFTLITKNGNRVPCQVRWRKKLSIGARRLRAFPSELSQSATACDAGHRAWRRLTVIMRRHRAVFVVTMILLSCR